MFLVFSLCPHFVRYSISFSGEGCKLIEKPVMCLFFFDLIVYFLVFQRVSRFMSRYFVLSGSSLWLIFGPVLFSFQDDAKLFYTFYSA